MVVWLLVSWLEMFHVYIGHSVALEEKCRCKNRPSLQPLFLVLPQGLLNVEKQASTDAARAATFAPSLVS